jgi:flagellar protein FliO/FliZ
MVTAQLTMSESLYRWRFNEASERGAQGVCQKGLWAMDWTYWLRAVAGLAATLALLGGLALLARRLGMLQAPIPGGKRRMAIVESLFLDPRRRVVIVRVDDSDHVLLLSPFGDHPIASKPAIIPAPAAEAEPPP